MAKGGKCQRLDDPLSGGVDHSLEAVFDPLFGEEPGYVVSCGEGPPGRGGAWTMSWSALNGGFKDRAAPEPGQLIEQRRAELLAKGHRPGIVNLAIDWAVNSAEGMANYFGREGDLGLYRQFLPKYLKDAERWIRSFDREG